MAMFEQACLSDKDNLIKYGSLFGMNMNEKENKSIDVDEKLKSFGIGKR